MNIIDIIKGSCRTYIFRHYPIEKQMNINNLRGYSQNEKDTMLDFIDSCRARANYLESLESLTINQIDYSDITPNGN